MKRHFDRLAAVVFALLFVLGCARNGDTVAPEPLIPDSPDGTVLAVARHLSDHEPAILWEALPESYRSDINELTRTFAAKMDPELYDRSMALARRAIEVLQDKQTIILGSSIVTSTGVDVDEVGRSMTSGLAAAHALMSSEITTVQGLGAVDWPQFLSTTGAQLLTLADSTAADPAAGGGATETSLASLRNVVVEVVSNEGDAAVIRVAVPGKPPEDVEMTRVEGRWVPAELAAEWPQKVAEARARLEELTPERIAELKPQAMFGLSMGEAFVDQVAAIQTSEEFDATVGPMLQSLMNNFAPVPPAAPGDEAPPAAGDEEGPPATP